MDSNVIILLTLLMFKHFVCDFPLQSFPYMYLNKGKLGHPGGILHAVVHGVGTLVVLGAYLHLSTLLAIVALAETVAHYFIDWSKMNINAHYGLKCDNSEAFWILLGADQLAHNICYVALLAVLVGR
jgi:hypothetical protein